MPSNQKPAINIQIKQFMKHNVMINYRLVWLVSQGKYVSLTAEMVVLNAWIIIEILQHICVEHYWGSSFIEWIQMKAFAMHRGVLILLHVMEARRRVFSNFWCYWCRLWSCMWEGIQLPKKNQDTLEVIYASRDIGQADFMSKSKI